MRKTLINLSNLHVGGGVQVGVSLISELSRSTFNLSEFDLWISTEIHENLLISGLNLDCFSCVCIINTYGIGSIFSFKINYKFLFKYSTVFTLFGPYYTIFKPNMHIVGFAQPSILYPDVAIKLVPNWFKKFLLGIKLLLQSYFFYRSDVLIVELDNVKNGLLDIPFFRKKKIYVVHNSCSNIYSSPKYWENINFNFGNRKIKLGFLGRNYPHKNTSILPKVLILLRSKFNLDVDIFVTFTNEEWTSCSDDFRMLIKNIGPLRVSQCPTFYSNMDGIIFPSLLECFSVTPLESLVMGKPIFLSDRDFNRNIVKDHGFYFDPLDPEDIAYIINEYFTKSYYLAINFNDIRNYALKSFNPKRRMEEYTKIIKDSKYE